MTATSTARTRKRDGAVTARGGSRDGVLRVRLLGPADACIDGRPLPRLRSRKGLWLLALLALRQAREVPRDWLTALLWPDSPEPAAAGSLRQSLADLRRALGPCASRLASPTPRSLRFDAGAGEVDVVDFDRLLMRDDPASLREAVALYRGPLLEGCSEEWVFQEREARQQALLDALERLAGTDAAHGSPAQAAQHWRRVVAIDPLRESAQRGLIQTLGAAGDFAAAVVAYRDLRLLLRQELGVDPDPATTAAYEQVRADARSAARVAPTAPRLDARPSAGAGPMALRVPRPLTGLVGRSREASEVREALAGSRLLTLTGPGGVGKTRLALHLATEAADDFPGGVWFVEMGSLTDPALLAATVASTMGLADRPGVSWTDGLVAHLQPLAALLVLDNCEHVLAASTRLTAHLLASCADLCVLVTSRQPLGLPGEAVYRVPSLAVPPEELLAHAGEAGGLAASLMGYEAIRLFVDRARAALSGFRLTDQNAVDVGRIALHLDGNPLALELAAARVRAMPVATIAARLDDRFRLLTSSNPSVPARHQALLGTMDWSHELLSQPERSLFRRLAVFAQGWSLDAAEAVCADPGTSPGCIQSVPVVDVLTSLVDQSLVWYDARSRSGRYGLLETVHEYAWVRLRQSGEATDLRNRHGQHYAGLARARYGEPPMDRSAWLDLMEVERANLRAALDWCQEAGEPLEGLRLAGWLAGYWAARGYRAEGLDRLTAALRRDGAQAHTADRMRALHRAANLAWTQGDNDAAAAFSREALEIAREIGDAEGVVTNLYMLGHAALGRGDTDEAERLYRRCLEDAAGDDAGRLAYPYLYLGEAARLRGDLAEARRLYEQSRHVAELAGDRLAEAMNAANLASLAYDQGDYAQARSLLTASLESVVATGDVGLVPLLLPTVAGILMAEGQPCRAARLLGAAEALRETSNTVIQNADRTQYARIVERVRAGCAAERFRAEWSAGRLLTLQAAVQQALAPAASE